MANSDTKTQGSRDRIVLIQFSRVGKAEVVGAMRRAFLASLARSGFHKAVMLLSPLCARSFPGFLPRLPTEALHRPSQTKARVLWFRWIRVPECLRRQARPVR